MNDQAQVQEASRRFYAALNQMANGNPDAMPGAWSHSEDATAMHPIGGLEEGWEAVKNSFEQVAQLAADGRITLEDQRINVVGDAAYEIGTEKGEFKLAGHHVSIEHRVTNVYQREGGTWKMIHHHTDTSPGMLDVLARLQDG